MKVSNNALNFLLAQYRAIFKRAYVKGLASAVLLTAGLAAGQAQAAEITDANANETLSGTATVTVDGGTTKFNISGTSAGTNITWNAPVTITSGAAGTGGNIIQASGGNVNITGEGSLLIDVGTNAATNGLGISGGASGSVTVDIASISINKGTLAIADGTSGGATVSADVITVGDATSAATNEATLTLSASNSGQSAILGHKTSAITINGDGKLQITAGSGTATVRGATLTLNDGAFFYTSGSGTNVTIEAQNLDFNSGSVHVVGDGTNAVTEKFTGQTGSIEGNLLVASGSTLQLDTATTVAEGETAPAGLGTVTLESGSNTVVSGTLTINNGTLAVADGATLAAAQDKATINVNASGSGQTATAGTLQISSSDLTAYLTGKDGTNALKYNSISTAGAVGHGDGTGASGSVMMSGGTIKFTDTAAVEVSDFDFSGSTAAAGYIGFASASTFRANHFTVSDKLTSGGSLMLESETLTLGSSSFDDSANNFAFSGATTQNLIVQSKNGQNLTLKDKVTLDVTVGGDTEVADETGSITGDLTIGSGGSLEVAHGAFTDSYDLTVNSGTLSVKNSALDDGTYMDSTLTLTGNLTLNAATSSKIEVNGGNADDHGAQTVLDITGVKDLTVVSGSSAEVDVQIVSGGTLRATGQNITDLIQTFTGSSGAKVLINDGTISVVGDLELDASNQLKNSGSAVLHAITFHSSNGGLLEVEDELTLNKVSSLNIGTEGKIVAGILNLNGSDNKTAASLSSGQYTALNSLTSNGTAGVTVGESAQVFLGRVEGAGTQDDPFVGNGGGSLTTDLTINKGSVEVAAGSWSSGKTVTVTSGTLTVGSLNNGSAYLDANGDELTSTLALGTLSVGESGSATINETGTLTVNGFTANGAVTVAGSATINGNKQVDNKGNITSYGVTIGANKVTVEQGAALTFRGAAVEALKYTGVSGSNGFIDAGTAFVANSITTQAGAEVTFEFAEGTEFSAAALKELRNEVFKIDNADGTIAGSINLGAATLIGIDPDPADGKYDWDQLSQYGDVLPNFTTDELKAGIVKNIETGDQVRGHFGALESSTITTGGKINIAGNTSLNNAAANGQFATGLGGALLGLDVADTALLELNNGGAVGEVALGNDSTLAINSAAGITTPGKTTIAAISGKNGVAEFGVGEIEVVGTTDVGNLITSAQSNVTFTGAVTVGSTGSDLDTELLGTNTFNAQATFNTNTEIGDQSTATFNQGVVFANWAGIYGNTAVTGGAEFGEDAEIGGGATLTADAVELTGTGTHFVVGEEDYIENGQIMPGSEGYLQTASMILNGNTLIIDPSYAHPTSVAAIEDFDDVVNNDDDAGTFSGDIFVGQNAALGVGQDITIADVQSFIKQYQNSRGALNQDQVGSVMYIDGMLTATAGSRIILDSQHTQAQVFEGVGATPALINDSTTYRGTYTVNGAATTYTPDLYLGQNTLMAVSDNILSAGQGKAIHFESTDASIMAQSVTDSADAAKIVLDGNAFLDTRNVTLFTDAGTNTGVKVLGDQDIRVETLNGVMYFMLEAGSEVSGGTLNLDTTKIDTAFLGATDESRDLLFAYTSHTANWEEYFDPANLAKDPQDPTYVEREELLGDAASRNLVTYDSTNGGKSVVLSQAAINAGYEASDFVAVPVMKEDGTQATDPDTGAFLGTVYHRAYNDLLESIVRNTNGAAADSAALQGVFGGAAQAALLAARTSQEAVAGRTGVGASSSALTFADNGQGAGLWVNPIYVSSESDGFAVSNKDYGVDIDLYGIALGGDYTLANGVRVGAFFNVGSGEADGNGQANGVSNDFDYYGVGLYAGYSLGQFSVVGDVSYSVVDSEVDASTAVGKITSSFDTDNLSVGVTGQYEFDFNGTLVTPHVGLRYSALSVDDYSFKAADYTQGGEASIDDANVFSIPVGVTIAKELAFNTWTVKPSLDVTVQGNFGDDELDSSASWDNVAWQSNYKSEFIDSFTYGATLGVAAKTGSFSAGIGLGYQGSSNTDEFSASANARFVF